MVVPVVRIRPAKPTHAVAAKKEAARSAKDVPQGPWESIRQVIIMLG